MTATIEPVCLSLRRETSAPPYQFGALLYSRPDRSFVQGSLPPRTVHANPRLDVLRQIFRVACNAGKPPRPPGVKPWQAQEVDSRNQRNAAYMGGLAAAVEDRKIDPAVVRAKPDALALLIRPNYRNERRM